MTHPREPRLLVPVLIQVGQKSQLTQLWVGSTFMDGHWLWPPPPPRAPSLINDLVFLIYEQPLQTRVGAPYGPARPAQLE